MASVPLPHKAKGYRQAQSGRVKPRGEGPYRHYAAGGAFEAASAAVGKGQHLGLGVKPDPDERGQPFQQRLAQPELSIPAHRGAQGPAAALLKPLKMILFQFRVPSLLCSVNRCIRIN